MEAHSIERKLAAIFAADVEGYSRLMGLDEVGTLRTLTAYRVIIDRLIAAHRGRIFSTAGDSLVADFASAVDAVECAVEVQDAIAKENSSRPAGEQMWFRVGIHVGDIIVQGDNLFGDAVNIAARLEALAEPGAICVSSTVRDQIGTKLPLSLTDLGEQQVKNIAQPIRAYLVRSNTSATDASAVGASLPLPDKPSIAVLPFANMSGDPEQEYFVDGVVEEIITAISRLPWLFVIARNSSFTYKGRAVDVKQVARELGVRYVLEGSVRKAGNRVRITAQLIDTSSNAHIWADRFDGALGDIFELQDQVASSVVGAIEPRLRQSEIERAGRKATGNLDAYDLYLRALAQFHKLTAESYSEAVRLASQALDIDASYAPAAALIAFARAMEVTQGWTRPDETGIAEMTDFARRAIQYGKDDPDALWMASLGIGRSGDMKTAASIVDRALSLNPNSAHAWMMKGFIHACQNQPKPSFDALERTMRLSPLDPLGYFFAWCRGLVAFEEGQYERAIEWADRSLRDEPTYLAAWRIKVAACGLLGKPTEAQQALTRMLELHPGLTTANYTAYAMRFNAPEVVVTVAEGLRKAGLPEE